MSEEQTPDVTGETGETGETGLAEADSVVAAVRSLDERPVEEHVPVYEDAHQRLRHALDAAAAD